MVSRLYALAVVALCLAAIAVCVPVLIGIVRDVNGPRGWGTDEERDRPVGVGDGRVTGEAAAEDTPERVVCGTCGAPNETGYRYCRRCAEPL